MDYREDYLYFIISCMLMSPDPFLNYKKNYKEETINNRPEKQGTLRTLISIRSSGQRGNGNCRFSDKFLQTH